MKAERLFSGDIRIEAKRQSAGESLKVVAFFLPTDPDSIPDEIQLFPPGEHEISPRTEDGKPRTFKIVIDAEAARVIAEDVRLMIEDAESKRGPRPFLDFNHKGEEASAWVTSVFWGGDDPITGGIRAKVEWTKAGRDAIDGKTYRQFSPEFYISKKDGRITGVGTSLGGLANSPESNMGGLVNNPAFRTIAPLFASDGGGDKPKPNNKTMEKILRVLVAAGIVSNAAADESECAASLAKWHEANTALLAGKNEEIKTLTGKVQAAEASVTTLKDQSQKLQAKVDEQADKEARSIVKAAQEDGTLDPKNEAIAEKWTALIKADSANAELLAGLRVGATDITQPVIKAASGAHLRTVKQEATETASDKITAAAKEIRKADPKLSEHEAVMRAAEANPEAYAEFQSAILDR